MDKKLTIKDIAKLANVSKSTVSRAINNQSTGIKKETKAKIEEIIQKYDFNPSKHAQAMRNSSISKTIGVIITRLTSSAENHALSKLLPLLYEYNYEPVIVESKFDPELLQRHLEQFKKLKVNGVIVFAFNQVTYDMLQAWAHKLIVIARYIEGIHSIYYDGYQAISLLAEKLYQDQHRNIAFIGVDNQDLSTGYQRYTAYIDFCTKHKLKPVFAQGSLDIQSGYNLIKTINLKQVTAIICATDMLALGVLKYLAEKKLTNKISLVGVGNSEILKFFLPQYIGVSLGNRESGKLAAEYIHKLINYQHDLPMLNLKIECKLIL